jgi:hypothetical protein
MNKLFLICLLAFFTSCGLNKQAQQLKALGQCDYKLKNASNVTIAGTNVDKLLGNKSLNVIDIPSLAFAFLRKDVPLKAKLNVQISNPTNDLAAINNFDYIILINQQEIATGTVNQRISINAKQSIDVPLQLSTNIYQFLANGKTLQDIGGFLSGAANGKEQKGLVTIKIKPSILVAGSLVKYPGFITIDKEVSNKILL